VAEDVKIKVRIVNGGIDGAPAWICTFVDMISLLVTFFILLFTFSSVRDYDAFTFQSNLVSSSGIWSEAGSTDVTAPDDDFMQAFDLMRGGRTPHERSADDLLQNIEEMGQRLTDEHIELDTSKMSDGLRIQFDERGGFAPGSARVNDVLSKALGELGRMAQHYPHTLVIEGFTDADFVRTPRYPTAEELSLARARAAADVLVSLSGMPRERLQVAGLGSRRPRSSDASALGRRADRRVEVRILAMDRARAKLLEEARR